MITFFDLETNSKEPSEAEILTGYFEVHTDNREVISTYTFKSQIDKWCEDAEKIHGISRGEMYGYPDKKKALYGLNNYLSNLPRDNTFICYANPNNFGKTIHFDRAVIDMNLMLYGYNYKLPNITSVYTLAKLAHSKNLFDPVINEETNRASFTQENVYYALFESKYNAHDAHDDVQALVELFYELRDMLNNNRVSKNKKQMELF